MPMCIKMSTFMGREKKRKPKSLLEMDSAVIFIKRNQTKLKLCVKNLPTSSACNKHPRTGQKQEFFRHRRVKQNKKPKKSKKTVRKWKTGIQKAGAHSTLFICRGSSASEKPKQYS